MKRTKAEQPTEALNRRIKENKAKKEAKELKARESVAVDRIEKLEKELEAALAVQKQVKAFTITPKPQSKGGEATAIAVASDWHVEETVRSDEVNGMNEYNLDISKKRASQFFERALHLTNLEAKNTPINTLVLALLGDFITGNIHDENMETCSLRPIDAALKAKSYIKSGIEFLLENSDLNLVVVCNSGNHARITKKIRNATEEGNSLETFVYYALAQEYEENPRVKFLITPSYHNYLQVYDMVLRFHHGHSIRYMGGVGGITIPVNKKINEWNKTKWADLDVFGHFHTFFDGSNFVANGSLIGFNAYALRTGCSFEKPKQAFFVINRRWKEKILVRPILFED